MTLADLRRWLKDVDPPTAPYWPGARTTNRVGLRTSQEVLDMGGAPLHPGVDRSQGRDFTMPFDGRVEWKYLPETQIGSFLRIVPHGIEMELHVFHTEFIPPMMHVHEHEETLKRGDKMPVKPSNLGLSHGKHLHTEVVLRYNDEIRDWLLESAESIVRPDGKICAAAIIGHCRKHGLNRDQVLRKIPAQVEGWGVSEMTTLFMARKWVGPDRVPEWGQGPTLHVDSKWLLDI